MADMLSELGVMYRTVGGWQKIHCPRSEYHSHNDKNKSCSYNYHGGVLKCHACGLAGGVIAVAKELNYDLPESASDDTFVEEPTFFWRQVEEESEV